MTSINDSESDWKSCAGGEGLESRSSRRLHSVCVCAGGSGGWSMLFL